MTNYITLQLVFMVVYTIIMFLLQGKGFLTSAPLLAIAFFSKFLFDKKYERNFTVNEYLSLTLSVTLMSVVMSTTELLLKIGSSNFINNVYIAFIILSIKIILIALAYFPYKKDFLRVIQGPSADELPTIY